jgi:lipid II:glycine glycyltransferase (peptidoglycan interpeptide bridge formation enzyme)
MTEITTPEWERTLTAYPDAHILQSASWGELKAAFGWQVSRVVAKSDPDLTGGERVASSGAQILFRKLPLGYSIAYIPKGPLGEDWSGLWPEVDRMCRAKRAVFLLIEPDLMEGEARQGMPDGFQATTYTIQPPRTLVVSLQGEEAELLGRMKQKTRYNIRLALKKDVVVRPFGDVELFYSLMEETGERDRFGVHSLAYYQKAYDLFNPRGECQMFLAESSGEPLAALMVFARGRRAWYFYGGSTSKQRDRMPTYGLQWEAMRWAKSNGCIEYDLWGVPDADEAALEDNFTARSDGLWGVYRFKRGFGGELCRSAGPWTRVYQPVLYRLFQYWTRREGNRG